MERERQSGPPGPRIAASHRALREALARRSAEAVAALYTEDARVLAPSAEVLTGREAIRRYWQAGLDSGLAGFDLQSLEARETESLSYEIGRYELRLQATGEEAVLDRGRYVLVHRLEPDGSWRRAVEMFSPDRPPTVVAPSEPLEGSPAPAT